MINGAINANTLLSGGFFKVVASDIDRAAAASGAQPIEWSTVREPCLYSVRNNNDVAVVLAFRLATNRLTAVQVKLDDDGKPTSLCSLLDGQIITNLPQQQAEQLQSFVDEAIAAPAISVRTCGGPTPETQPVMFATGIAAMASAELTSQQAVRTSSLDYLV